MNQTEKEIYAPNLNLYAFNLAEGLDEISKIQKFNPNWLKDSCSKILFNFSKLKQEVKSYPLSFYQPQLPEKILIYPRQIKDTHTLIVNLYHPQKQGNDAIKITQLEELNKNNCLDIDIDIRTNIGKTLLFNAFVTEAQIPNLKDIANDCLKNLIPNTEKQRYFQENFFRQDKLFNSHLFVYGNPKEKNHQSYQQVLILFFTEEKNKKNFNKIYRSNLRALLLDYHKIVTAYDSGKQEYLEAVKEFNIIRELLTELQEQYKPHKEQKAKLLEEDELKNLKNKLIKLLSINSNYSERIGRLERYQSALAISLDNYQINLENLRQKIQENEEIQDYFTYLKNRILPTLQKELNAKVTYIAQGSILIQEATANIRGLIEINQAEIDRTSQKLFAAIGAGIAVGGIIASSSGQVTLENPIYLKCLPDTICEIHPFIKFVGLSIGIGLLASCLIYKLWDKKKK